MSTYAVVGGTLWGNRGAEAMVVTTIGRIRDREPDASFLLMSYMAKRDKALVQDPAVNVIDATPGRTLVHLAFATITWLAGLVSIRLPGGLLPSSVRDLRDCRALLDVSGISFHDGRLPVVAYNVLCVLPAMLLRVPVIRLSQAMGPFEHPLNRFLARWVTGRSLHTFSRGRITSAYVEQLNVPRASWSQAADVAFSYRARDSLTHENDAMVAAVAARLKRVTETGIPVVALVPSSLILKKSGKREDSYLGLLHVIVTHVRNSGLHTLVLPNATSEGANTLRNNDIAVIARLRDYIARQTDVVTDEDVTYVDFDINTESIRSLIEPSALVITSRFHAMVAALALGVPPFVIGWSHKYEEVLEEFGCADYAADFSEAEHNLLLKLDDLLRNRDAVRQRIMGSLPSVSASSERQFAIIDSLKSRLNGTPGITIE
jgi:polysaccharide pyruvyl transferase WcaK-like protein